MEILIVDWDLFLAPPITQQKLKDFDISRGQEVTITVTANGTPLPSCTWFHNDKQLHAKANRIIMINDGPTHILKLLDVELTDAGFYKVKYQNLFFSSFKFFSFQGGC